MDKRVVIGIFATDSMIGEVLKQIGFMLIDDRSISVFCRPEFMHATYPTNLGPLHGAKMENVKEKLIHLGLGASQAIEATQLLKDGGVAIAVAVDDEMVEDIVDLFNEGGATIVENAES